MLEFCLNVILTLNFTFYWLILKKYIILGKIYREDLMFESWVQLPYRKYSVDTFANVKENLGVEFRIINKIIIN